MRKEYAGVIDRLLLMGTLGPFAPVVIGTPPLGIAVPSSDIDIACSAPDLEQFTVFAETEFGQFENFQLRETKLQNQPSIVVQFRALDWDFEIVCQRVPTEQQWGVRHFRIEKRLLKLLPGLVGRISELKLAGMKTEPAFAQTLGLAGDPYQAVLELEKKSDAEMIALGQK